MSRRGRARATDDTRNEPGRASSGGPETDPTDPKANGARVTLWGIVRQRGGYRLVEVRLPESEVDRYSTDAGAAAQPDLLEVTLSKVETAMRREVM